MNVALDFSNMFRTSNSEEINQNDGINNTENSVENLDILLENPNDRKFILSQLALCNIFMEESLLEDPKIESSFSKLLMEVR